MAPLSSGGTLVDTVRLQLGLSSMAPNSDGGRDSLEDDTEFSSVQIEAALADPDLDQALISEAKRLLNPAELTATLQTYRDLDTADIGSLKPDQVSVPTVSARNDCSRQLHSSVVPTAGPPGVCRNERRQAERDPG